MSHDTARSDARPMAAPPGGVMTREVGAVTGDLEVWLDAARPGVVRVRYAGALEEYTVVGTAPGATIDDVVARLSRDPGPDPDGNPASTDLTAAPPAVETAEPQPDEPATPSTPAADPRRPEPAAESEPPTEPRTEPADEARPGGPRRARRRGGREGRRDVG